jgi:phosphoribosyl 1,2-cyclic phosphodiesterase
VWKSFIIDIGESWIDKSFFKKLLGRKMPILITHAHPDHMFGLLEMDLKRRSVYMSGASLASEYFKEKKEDLKELQGPVFHRSGVFVLEGRRCVSVPVLHSLKAPNVALFFEFCGKKICHATDVLSIRKADREKYLKGVDIYIGDGSSLERSLVRFKKKDAQKGKPYGHMSVKGQLRWARDAGVKCCIFTHWGSEAIKMGERELTKRVQEIAKKIGYEGKILIARDGAYLELPSMKWVTEQESITGGLYDEYKEELKECIVEIKDLPNYEPTKVRDDKVLGDDWRILLAWWANYYAPKAPKTGQKFKYPKELILQKAIELAKEMIRRGFKFDLPKDYKPGARDLFLKVIQAIGLDKFTWKTGEKVEYIWDVEKSLPGLYLKEPHARWLWEGKKTLIVKAKPYTKHSGKPLYLLGEKAYGVGKLSKPDGPHLADKVRVEMRDKHLVSDDEWKQWWGDTKEVWIYTWKWLEKFDEPKDYVRLKGPQVFYKSVKLIESITETQADLLIKKYVDSGKWDKMKVEDREKLMNKRQFLDPLYPFSPTKTAKKGYRELELFDRRSVANLAKEWFEEHPGASIYVEVKFDGMRTIGHKKGDQVRIWSEGGERLDDNLPTLVAGLKKLRCDSCILDAEVVPYDEEGNALGRRACMRALGKGKVDDSRWIAHVFDLLYLNGKDLHKRPYEERRKLLRGLELPRADVPKRFNWHWVENIPREARDVEDVIKYVREVSGVPFSEGAMLKLSDSDYPLTKRTPLWAKYKKFFDIDVMVVHKFPKRYQKGPKKGQPIPGQNNLACVIGPVTPPKDAKVYDLNEVWKEERSMENYKEWKGHKIQYIRHKGKVYSNIGITMSTAEDVKIGDIIRCTVRLIRKINDTEYHWLIARVLEPRPEKTKPDPTSTADSIAKVSQYKIKSLLEESIIEVDGESFYDLERLEELLEEEELFIYEVREFFEDVIQEALVQEDDYMILPDENKVWRFGCQAHCRGVSVHLK